MKYDFDEIVDRKNTLSCKWDLASDDILPMWVADMDFRTAKPIVDALVNRAQSGVFGYSVYTDDVYEAITGWFKRRHNWEIEKEWVQFSPGIVPALHAFTRIFVKSGEKILMNSPVYYPFFKSAERNGIEAVNSVLLNKNGRYEIDFKDFEKKAADPLVKMFYLCSPQNPGGRLWSRGELEKIGRICLENNVLVVADEIHCDLVYPGKKHISFGTLSDDIVDNSIICTAPTKTFNLAGLQISSVIIKNPELRKMYADYMTASGFDYGEAGTFGLEAIRAAYKYGDEWLDSLMEYINGNLEFLLNYVKENIPKAKVMVPDATYLVWIDFSDYKIDSRTLHKTLKYEGKIWLDEGYLFGKAGEGFERINIACPRRTLEEGLKRIKDCINRMDSQR